MRNLTLYILFFIAAACADPIDVTREKTNDNTDYERAFEFLNQRQADSAFIAFSRAKEWFSNQRDSFRVGSCLVQMAIILTNQSDYFGGQETSLEALAYLDTHNPDHATYLSANFNNLGIATHSLKDYGRAVGFYDSAIKYSSDSLHTLTYVNNKARVYHSMKEFDKALELYAQIEGAAKKRPRGYARLLTNMTLAKWRNHPQYNAAPEFLVALRIREESDDLSGQGSSYMHLSDYYIDHRPDSALLYARKFYATSMATQRADDQIRALYRLIRLNVPDSAKHYFEIYKALSDSVHLARETAKNRFALIRYEVEKNKAENLRLQQENVRRAYQVARQRIWTVAVALFAAILLSGGRYWYKKRQQRLELESENRIRAHRLNTSKKIHDVVANGIYRVMAEIENRDEINRDGILDRLENMYEQSRDISYDADEPKRIQNDYHERIAELLKSFATGATKIIIAGNAPEIWYGMSSEVKAEIAYILQEMMVNMRKHSRATDVVIRFERSHDQLHISYGDNGVGLPDSFVQGNGLINTGSRIERLQGQINFVSEGERGLSIEVALPIA